VWGEWLVESRWCCAETASTRCGSGNVKLCEEYCPNPTGEGGSYKWRYCGSC
jgi:hypothetical protein